MEVEQAVAAACCAAGAAATLILRRRSIGGEHVLAVLLSSAERTSAIDPARCRTGDGSMEQRGEILTAMIATVVVNNKHSRTKKFLSVPGP